MADQANTLDTPLASPVFQGVLGVVLVLASTFVVESFPVPRQLTVATLALGAVLLASGVWHMFPRSADVPAFDD